jgi:hypothetical protein
MNITGGGKVTLNPKNKNERVALRVLQLITGDQRLDTVILQHIGEGKEESNVDCTLDETNNRPTREQLLDFFKDVDKFDIISIVFRWRNKNA